MKGRIKKLEKIKSHNLQDKEDIHKQIYRMQKKKK